VRNDLAAKLNTDSIDVFPPQGIETGRFFSNFEPAPLGPITTFSVDDGRIMMDPITNGKITHGFY